MLLTTNYRKSENVHVLEELLGRVDGWLDKRPENSFAQDPLYRQWFRVALCHDFAHGECDWVPQYEEHLKPERRGIIDPYDKMPWVESVANYGWRKEVLHHKYPSRSDNSEVDSEIDEEQHDEAYYVEKLRNAGIEEEDIEDCLVEFGHKGGDKYANKIEEFVAEFDHNPDCVNQWGDVSNYLSDVGCALI